jgi:hypothetical protein
MGANSKPWTDAITELLSDGEWHTVEDALAAGAAQVSSARALQEMGDKQTGQPAERRMQIGKRNVATQALTGMFRFGKVEYGDGKKTVRKSSAKSTSLGEVLTKVKALETALEDALLRVEALESERDQRDAASLDPAAGLLAAAGLQTADA